MDGWSRSCLEGLELAHDYINAHAFIHDDQWVDVAGDRDELSGHPLLVDAPLVVTSRTVPGPGPADMIALNHTGSGSGSRNSTRIITTTGASPLADLVNDNEKLCHFTQEVSARRLDLSVFYADRPELCTIKSAIESNGARCAIHPDPRSYSRYTDHCANVRLLRSISDLWPESYVCEDEKEIHRAAGKVGFPLYCKHLDSRTEYARRYSDIAAYIQSEGFPILIQKEVEKRKSIVFHWISWKGRTLPLFILGQILKNGHHAGNEYSAEFERFIVRRYSDVLKRSMALLPDWQGFAGMDLILTDDPAGVIPIDLNARFNSSTLPFVSLFPRTKGEKLFSKYVYMRHDGATRDSDSRALEYQHLTGRTQRFGGSRRDAISFTLTSYQ